MLTVQMLYAHLDLSKEKCQRIHAKLVVRVFTWLRVRPEK